MTTDNQAQNNQEQATSAPAKASQKPNGKKPQNKPQHRNEGQKPQREDGGAPNTSTKIRVESLKDLKSLVKMAPGVVRKSPERFRAPLPNLMSYKGDGQDHINVSKDARTDLGKLLSTITHLPFEHPIMGRFVSIIAFNFFLTSAERDDRMRSANAKDLYALAEAGNKVTVHGLWTLMFYATWVQINSYPALVEAIKANTLPFDLYIQRNLKGMPVNLYRPDTHDVFLEIINGVARSLKNQEEPIFRGASLEKMHKLSEDFSALGASKTQAVDEGTAETTVKPQRVPSLLQVTAKDKPEPTDLSAAETAAAEIKEQGQQIVDTLHADIVTNQTGDSNPAIEAEIELEIDPAKENIYSFKDLVVLSGYEALQPSEMFIFIDGQAWGLVCAFAFLGVYDDKTGPFRYMVTPTGMDLSEAPMHGLTIYQEVHGSELELGDESGLSNGFSFAAILHNESNTLFIGTRPDLRDEAVADDAASTDTSVEG